MNNVDPVFQSLISGMFPTLDKNTQKNKKTDEDCGKCKDVVDCFMVNKTGCDLYV